MSRGGPPQTVVAELVPAGRAAAARPVFEPGPVIPLVKRLRGDARIGDLVTVRVRGRSAEVVAVHGRARWPPAAIAALLASEGLDRPFPRAALEEAEASAASDEDAPARRDLTGLRALTIDPEGAKDHDDAVGAVAEGGGVRLYVHIADVARYVPEGGAVDREAQRRGCSVYLPGTVVPMLPPALSNDACSLRPGVDRSAVTVEMVVGPDGEVGETRFSRTTIRSERRLTYPEVDALFDGRGLGDVALERELLLLRVVAARLGARRRARGALEIGGAEPVFRFAGDRLIGVDVETQTESHRLIEECMIAANEAVARYLIARGTPTVFRYHEDPDPSSVEQLYDRLAALDVATPPLPDGPLAPSECARAVRAAAEAVARHVARTGTGGRALPGLVLRALKQAYYTPDRVGHSGLASPAYLHFTSPIRRYPDLMVHRGLLDTLGLGPPGPRGAALGEAAQHSSETEREAAALEHRGDAVCLAFLLRDELTRRGWDEAFAGEITGVISSGCFAVFGRAYEGFLPARRLDDDWYRPDPLDTQLIGSSTGRRIRLGDRVRLRVTGVEPLRGRVDLEDADAPPSSPPPPRRGRLGAQRAR